MTLDQGMTEKIISPKAKPVIASTTFCVPVSRSCVPDAAPGQRRWRRRRRMGGRVLVPTHQ